MFGGLVDITTTEDPMTRMKYGRIRTNMKDMHYACFQIINREIVFRGIHKDSKTAEASAACFSRIMECDTYVGIIDTSFPF